MLPFGKQIVKLRIPILIVSILLLIPSAIGYFNTRVTCLWPKVFPIRTRPG